MGENLKIEGRLAVRTPMQWTSEPGAGFSTADPSKFPAPLTEGDYGPQRVNVEDERRDSDSLLCWMRMLIERYRECPELAWGDYEVLDAGHPAVLAHCCRIDGSTVLIVHNLCDSPVDAALTLDGPAELTSLLHNDIVKAGDGGRLELSLEPYACRWLRVTSGT